MSDNQVLITSDAAKLPPQIAALLDPAVPIPSNILFFEKRYDLAEMINKILLAIGFGLGAIVVIPFGVAILFEHRQNTVYSHVSYWPLGFGCVLALAAWMMSVSVAASWRLRNAQSSGQCTRMGTFLFDDCLIQASENDTTIIPIDCFLELVGRTIKYRHNNADKSFALPRTLVDHTSQELESAITTWASAIED